MASAIARMSPPDENADPAPVTISTRTDASACARAKAAISASTTEASLIGLRASGRLSVTVAIAPFWSNRIGSGIGVYWITSAGVVPGICPAHCHPTRGDDDAPARGLARSCVLAVRGRDLPH